MTTPRRDGWGSPFGEWVRHNPRLQDEVAKLSVSDIDWQFHQYMPKVDGKRTRSLRLMFTLELKTHGKDPTYSQRENLWFLHKQTQSKRSSIPDLQGRKVTVWNYGAFFLKLHGEKPRPAETIEWGTFAGESGQIKWRHLRTWELEDILRFEKDPGAPDKRLSIRAHHLTREYVEVETHGLLFPMYRIRKSRS